MRKNLLVYVLVLLAFGIGVAVILERGSWMSSSPPATSPQGPAPAAANVIRENLRHPLSILLIQMIVVVAAAKGTAAVFRRLAQPAVIGEMVAGILLGPSLLGWLLPSAYVHLFPASSMDALQLFSQLGVILFMFGVGMDLEVRLVRQQAHTAVLVSHAGIVVPFFLGVALTLVIYRDLAPAHVPFVPFALFVGIAMSITAFPVLARIIADRGLTGTRLGAIAIACAAVDDVTAWCLLAVVVAIAKSDGLASAAFPIALTLAFAVVMLLVVRPRVGRLVVADLEHGSRGTAVVATVLSCVFAASLFTEAIGIHALFGAFLAGVVVSSHARVRAFMKDRIEIVGAVVLLPLFFAFAGLRTQIGLLESWRSWLTCALLIGVAVAGKLGGGTLAARLTGMTIRESLALGTLMNARGLMELIVLNVGYDLGILSPALFAMMVLMALTTTCMTTPILALLEKGVGDPPSVKTGGKRSPTPFS